MAVKVQLRRGTASEWTAANPTLSQGELGVELDTTKFKVGNGSTAWNSLVYASVSFRGVHNPTTIYYPGDIATSGGSSYICVQTTTSGILATNTTYWSVFAQKGTDGEVTLSTAQTLTNKTIALGSNTLSGTLAQFNTAVTDADLVSLAGTETLTNKIITSAKYTVIALGSISGTNTLDLAAATEFTATIGGATTMAFSNAPGAGSAQVVYLRLTNAGSAAITWPANTKFAGGTAPTLTSSGVDLLAVKYDIATTTYQVFVIGLDVK